MKTVSPTLVNELLVSGSREYADILSGDPSVYYADQLGTPNPLHVTGFPVLGGFGIGATNYFQPANRRTRFLTYYILEDNATKVMGKHESSLARTFAWTCGTSCRSRPRRQATFNSAHSPPRFGTARRAPRPRPRR